MTPDLTDRDRERFDRLRSSLSDVTRGDRPDPAPPSEEPFDPMLAETFTGSLDRLDADNWIAERKFDGTRIILHRFDGSVRLHTRRHVDRSETLEELARVARDEVPDGVILDGEYCYFTPDGTSRFVPIHQADDVREREDLTGRYRVFDVLATDGAWHLREPVLERKSRLDAVLPAADVIAGVDHVGRDVPTFYEGMVDRGEEGIMLKRRGSPYHPGVRSQHWRKVKAFTEADLIAVGRTDGEGRRADTFGALVLTDSEQYVGRVGSGFSEADLERLSERMVPIDERPVSPREVEREYTPVEPFVVRVTFQEINRDGRLRAPVFVGTVEKPIEDVEPIVDR